MVTEPHEATSPSSRVSISPRTLITTSDAPIEKPPVGSGTESRRAEVYCAIEGGGSTKGSGTSDTGGVEGSGAFGTTGPAALRATSGATGGPAGNPGAVATHCAR